MFFAEAQIRVHLCGQPTTCVKSYGRDCRRARAMRWVIIPWMARCMFSSTAAARQIKCLYFDRSGFCIWGKRLETGKFNQRLACGTHARDGLDGIEAAARGIGRQAGSQALSLPSVITKSL